MKIRAPDIFIEVPVTKTYNSASQKEGLTNLIDGAPAGKCNEIIYLRIKNIDSITGRITLWNQYGTSSLKKVYSTILESHEVDELPIGFTPSITMPIFSNIYYLYAESEIKATVNIVRVYY